MTRKSYGKMRGCRLKLRAGRKPSITTYLREFKQGEKVHIDLVPSSPLQHPRFQGKTGMVEERRGNSYKVSVDDIGKKKFVFLRPEHMNPAR